MENTFEEATLALLDAHEDRFEALEEKFLSLKLSLILALKQSGGIDLVKAMSFIDSRVPKLDVPVAAPVVLTTNQKLKPGPSGVIPPPPDGAGDDGAPSPKGTHEQQ